MRNLPRNSVQDESGSNNSAADKSSAKKLKQARLPFKVIAPSTSPVGSKSEPTATATDKDDQELRNCGDKEQQSADGRKRKLSYDDDNESLIVIGGKEDSVSKENVEIVAAATKKKKISTIINNDISEEVVSLLEGENDDVDINENVANTSASNGSSKQEHVLKTPKVILKDKRKGAGTPQTCSVQKERSGSISKLQIKLPLSAGKKNKRRKSKRHQMAHSSGTEGGSQELSGDDAEDNGIELNPQKRKKPNDDNFNKNREETDCKTLDIDTITIDSEPETEKEKDERRTDRESNATESKGISGNKKSDKEILKKLFQRKTKTENNDSKQQAKTKEKGTSSKDDVMLEENSPKSDKISKDSELLEVEEKKINANLEFDISVKDDNGEDDEMNNITAKLANVSSEISDDAKSNPNTTADPQTDVHNRSVTGKTLTPKQIKLMEHRRKAREEKERKLQEEKMKRQQEKEERELAKKREREEKEDQKRRDREEKEEQKRKEREDKERKRLAEIEAKNEEKRRRNEAREEELRKKEEERKRKEQEKEEAELKKKKAAQAFTKFFVAKIPTNNQLKNDDDSSTEDGTKLLAFRPFQVKGDMKLAPICRKIFTPEDKNRLDILCGTAHKGDDDEDIVRCKPLPKSQLYLAELRSGKIMPGKWRRPSTESKDDVIIVEDELERVGQAIVEDTPAYIREQMRVKFYKFHDNRRPPYYGTWRKKSEVVKPRRPFAQDKKVFDYEVDSDDEWEEEEPGESLEDGSDDDKEKESEDDDYEVDNEWFVPHGHLSDEELQNGDENGVGNDNTREAQKVKLQILQQEFAQEMKKKTEKIKPRLIGCIWADVDGNQPSNCANILWDALEKKAMLLTEPPIVEEMETENSVETTSPSSNINNNQERPTTDKLKPITLSDNMVKDLIRVIHGNNHSKNFLINEYIAYIEKTEESVKNGDLRKPLKSVIRDKIDEMAEWQAVDAKAASIQDMEQNSDEGTENNKKKKKCKRRLCWVVKQEILDKMNLSSLELHNSWKYTLPPKFVKAEKDVKSEANAVATTTTISGECNSALATEAVEDNAAQRKDKNTTSQITKFAKVLTAEEKSKKLQNAKPASLNITTDKAVTETKPSKEKKRVPLLMSVPRGQQIATPAKNKLISQFLQQKNKEKEDTQKHSSSITSTRLRTTAASPTVEDDDIVILD